MSIWQDIKSHFGFGNVGNSAFIEDDLRLSPPIIEQKLNKGGLLATVCEAPAEDIARAWRTFPEGSDAWVNAEETLGVRDVIERALVLAEAYGGAFIIPEYSAVGISAQRLAEPFRTPTGGLLGFKAYPQTAFSLSTSAADHECVTGELPDFLDLKHMGSSSGLTIHTSWLIPVHGPDAYRYEVQRLHNCDELLGTSRLRKVWESYCDLRRAVSNLSFMLEKANIDVLKLQGLAAALAECQSTDEIAAAVQKTIEGTAASLAGADIRQPMIIDSESDLTRHSMSFSGGVDIARLMLELFTAVSRIPETRLLGKQAAGLSNTDTPGLTAYYDRVASMRERVVTPILNRMDEIAAASIGGISVGVMWEFNPLFEMTPEQVADIEKKRADTDKVYFDMGVPFIVSRIVERLHEHSTYSFSDEEVVSIREQDIPSAILNELTAGG